jgi:outer membrane protein assembly factor BamB
VVDGTVFVGSFDDNVYALDAGEGSERWSFQTGNSVISSPTVVDGTVFVGSYDGNVYALDAGVDGSSEGSRVNLGTLGHHHVWAPQGSKDANRSDSENGGETESEGSKDANRSDSENGGETESKGSKDANRSDSENGGETESSADGGTSIAALSAGGGAAAGLLYLARDIIDNDDIDDTTDDH